MHLVNLTFFEFATVLIMLLCSILAMMVILFIVTYRLWKLQKNLLKVYLSVNQNDIHLSVLSPTSVNFFKNGTLPQPKGFFDMLKKEEQLTKHIAAKKK